MKLNVFFSWFFVLALCVLEIGCSTRKHNHTDKTIANVSFIFDKIQSDSIVCIIYNEGKTSCFISQSQHFNITNDTFYIDPITLRRKKGDNLSMGYAFVPPTMDEIKQGERKIIKIKNYNFKSGPYHYISHMIFDENYLFDGKNDTQFSSYTAFFEFTRSHSNEVTVKL